MLFSKYLFSYLYLVVDSDRVLNVGRDKAAKIIFHNFDNHIDFYFLYFFPLYWPALKTFSNNFEITSIFQCLIKHFYLIHVRILITNLYLTHDSVCNDIRSYRNIQVRRRIRIIFKSFIRAPLWCDVGYILQWHAEIGLFNAKLVKYPFKYKYRANVCRANLNKFYTVCCKFLLLLICASDIEINPGPRKNNTSCKFSFCH